MKISHNEFYEVLTQAAFQLQRNLKEAYDNDYLEGYLSEIGMSDLLPSKEESFYETFPDGKIVIIGDSSVKTNDIYGIFKSYGLSKDRVELVLDYNEAEVIFLAWCLLHHQLHHIHITGLQCGLHD